MNKQNRILFNTAVLNVRMVLSAVAVLIGTRVVLAELGSADFGLYNLLAGVVSMLSFLNAAMSASTQRYLSYALGRGCDAREVFYNSVVLHAVVALLVAMVVLAGGHLFLNSLLNIPVGREAVAGRLVNYLCAGIVFTIFAVPYDGVFNAHENMLVVSLIGVFESILKLCAACAVIWVSTAEKVAVYALLMCGIPFVSLLFKCAYSRRHFPETRYRLHRVRDVSLFRGMFAFAGWNFIGALMGLVRAQGYAVLFNVFGSVVVNAAYGIASQVNSQVSFFSETVVKALRPQIVISEGAGDHARTLRLSDIACKVPFLLLVMVAVPLMVETETVLHLWLTEVPHYTCDMVRLTLLVTLINLSAKGTQITIEAVGRIRQIQIGVGLLNFLSVPLGYILILCGVSVGYILLGVVASELAGLVVRVWSGHIVAGLDVRRFVCQVLLRNAGTLVLVLIVGIALTLLFTPSLLRLLMVVAMSVTATSLFGYSLALTVQERQTALAVARGIINKIKTPKS